MLERPLTFLLYKLYFNHRIKLIISILETKASDSPPGGGLNVSDLLSKKVVLAGFPIHDFEELNALQNRWLSLCAPPWTQPIDAVKDYFGERIGLYFYFLQHYTELLITPAFFGCISYCYRAYEQKTESLLMPYFTCYMVIWSTFFLEFWKGKQSTIAMKWGVCGFEDEEEDRPQFEGITIKSPVTGEEMSYFPSTEFSKRANMVQTAICACILGVVVTVGGIFFFQYWLNLPANQNMLVIFGFNGATIVAPLLSAIVINVLNALYTGVAVSMNDYENHRTATEYEDALISKIFVFQLVNSFASLTYVSFVKSFIGLICGKNSCYGDVASTLSTVFLSALIVRAIKEVIVRKVCVYRYRYLFKKYIFNNNFSISLLLFFRLCKI